ncbi:hypothetical protein GOBAR_DD04363 [Gossypium barbadense]|nr:hypothetical protein GOBAR_DD04363 [Gossypium barbadense]
MEIQHVIHHHPLSLSFIKEGSTLARCRGCHRYLIGPTYGCERCWYFIHKSCLDEHKAESIPQQLINHHIHPCTLIFITYPYGRDECACCGERIVPRMKFSCGACEFDLHVKCALFPTIDSEDAKEIQHFSHSHTLALVQNDEEYGSERRCVACAQIW